MPSILETLRAQQKAAGLTASRPDDDSSVCPIVGKTTLCETNSNPGVTPQDPEKAYIESRQPGWREENRLAKDDNSPSELDIDPDKHPSYADPEAKPQHFGHVRGHHYEDLALVKQLKGQFPGPLPAVDLTIGRGYCKIFPPTFPNVGSIPEDWKKDNWTGPSPWCRVEGFPDHPDFETNLDAFER